MSTKVRVPAARNVQPLISEDIKDSLSLMDTLKAIGQCKITKDATDAMLHPLLDKALVEVKGQGEYATEVFLRNLFYTFSIQRQHNIWKRESVKSGELGAQMRKSGRSIARWLANNMSEWLYIRRDGYLYNLNLLVEYANYDLLTHNQLRTSVKGSKKKPSKVISHESQNIPLEIVAELMAQNYRRNQGRSLIARWLPNSKGGKVRYTTLVVGKDIKRKKFNSEGKAWVKVNGKFYKGGTDIPLSDGDVITYPRELRKETLERKKWDAELMYYFCQQMGWDTKQYKKFRHEYMQLTPEHLFSSGSIVGMTKDIFYKWLEGLSAGQQWVVSSTLCYKDKLGSLMPKPGKWENTDFPKWYKEWMSRETEKTEEIRKVMATGDSAKVKALSKEVKVKTTGLHTMDLLTELLGSRRTEQEINTMHTQLLAKMDMLVPVYSIIDGSASMNSATLVNSRPVAYIDIACCLALTFMATNPVEEFRSSCMWFGSESIFTGVTKYLNAAPNQYVQAERFTKQTGPRRIVDPAKSFTENLRSLRAANPNVVASTNAGQVVVTFIKLVQTNQMNVESLPRVLLFITDEEYNQGVGPVEANGTGFTQMPQHIGWNPLFVFWGLKTTSGLDKYKDAPNTLVTRGFQESNLSEILQFIKKGSISMFDELFAVHEMPGLSLITV